MEGHVTTSSRKRYLLFYFAFSYVYLLSGYCYLSLPPAWSIRVTNLTPGLSRMLEFIVNLLYSGHLPLAVWAFLQLFAISLVALGLFVAFEWLLSKAFSEQAASKEWPRLSAAFAAVLLSLFFFGPYYQTSQ